MPSRSIVPIILCGGSGTRLWPRSRLSRPKQFATFGNENSLLQQTALRFSKPVNNIEPLPAIVIGSEKLGNLMETELSACDANYQSLILEPFGMDSAPALAVSLVDIMKKDPDTICCMVPSDHNISNMPGFFNCIENAIESIERFDWIVTFGIQPTGPETQFGYIERDEFLQEVDAFKVKRFHEKPDLDTAREFLRRGRFFWNSGMFFFRAKNIVDAFKAHDPNTWEFASKAVENGQREGKVLRLEAQSFKQCTRQSIDYAIMEKVDNIGVVASQFEWSDLGSWGQIYDVNRNRDDHENVVLGDTITHDTCGCYISSKSRLIAVAGARNLAIIEDEDAILVVDREKSSHVKELVGQLKDANRSELHVHPLQTEITAEGSLNWLTKEALPFWMRYGVDTTNGGVYEHLNFDGSPAQDDHKRFRVLPRQIFCFAEAKSIAPEVTSELDQLLKELFDYMVASAWHEDGGWVHQFNPDGTPKNVLRDTYDQCFVLLACASLYEATRWSEARKWADKTLAFLDSQLHDSANGGYFENSDHSLPRRANPHMHFLEAMLKWFEVTGEHDFLERAKNIVELFETRFFNQEHGVVAEFFDAHWAELKDDRNQLVEPGHLYEWATLLLRFDQHHPTEGLQAKALRLVAHANTFGHFENGTVRNFIQRNGAAPTGSAANLYQARCWPQTEALKLGIQLRHLGVYSADNLIANSLKILFERYLLTSQNCMFLANEQAKPGGWIDTLNSDGEPETDIMPLSTFYHVLGAIKELNHSTAENVISLVAE